MTEEKRTPAKILAFKMRQYKKQLSLDGKWFYIRELTKDEPLKAGWCSVTGEKDEKLGVAWLPFAFWKVKAGIVSDATPEEVELYLKHYDQV